MNRLLFLVCVGGLGAAILVALGIWQVQRLAWKEDLLARIEARIDAPPVPLAEAVAPEFQRYAPVALSGTFGPDHARMLASRKTIGPVHRILRPFEADGFGPVLIDTGWQPVSAPVTPPPTGTVQLIGNLDAPIEADGFTPAPDLDAGLWFARDVPALAAALGTRPVLVVLRAAPAPVSDLEWSVTPWPVDTAGIPNDHLQYAVTWFSLAAIWLGMTAYFLHRARGGVSRRD